MRTFHTGGIAPARTSPRVCRASRSCSRPASPSAQAIISEIDGVVRIRARTRRAAHDRGDRWARTATIRKTMPSLRLSHPTCRRATWCRRATCLTEGSVNPHDILAIKGVNAVQDYLISEVQSVYRLQGVDINDKHIEVIVRQMMRKVQGGRRRRHQPAARFAWWISASSANANAEIAAHRRARRDGPADRHHAHRCCWVSPRPPWPPIPSCRRPPSRRPPAC